MRTHLTTLAVAALTATVLSACDGILPPQEYGASGEVTVQSRSHNGADCTLSLHRDLRPPVPINISGDRKFCDTAARAESYVATGGASSTGAVTLTLHYEEPGERAGIRVPIAKTLSKQVTGSGWSPI